MDVPYCTVLEKQIYAIKYLIIERIQIIHKSLFCCIKSWRPDHCDVKVYSSYLRVKSKYKEAHNSHSAKRRNEKSILCKLSEN